MKTRHAGYCCYLHSKMSFKFSRCVGASFKQNWIVAHHSVYVYFIEFYINQITNYVLRTPKTWKIMKYNEKEIFKILT